ncbi:MAG: FecCD family ABC transporter permease [archaeon]
MKDNGKTIYSTITTRKKALVLSAGASIVFFFILDLMTGPSWLTVNEVLTAIFNPSQSPSASEAIVWSLRLPVALTAIVVGASLGIAGAEMQTILDNPLAEPYTLGISSAAGFGAGLAITFGIGISGAGEFLISINAFFFSLLSCLLIYFIARTRSSDKSIIILAGVALLFLFQSLIGLVQYFSSSTQTSAILFWMFGSLAKTTWISLGINCVVLAIVLILFAMDTWKLTALKLGDNKARSLGVNIEGLRRKVLILVSVITATAVSFVGTIGFIGLVGPHIARLLVGDDQRFFLPLSALTGSILMSVASTLSKLVTPGSVFPIGIITSFIGVPFFLSLLLKRRTTLP